MCKCKDNNYKYVPEDLPLMRIQYNIGLWKCNKCGKHKWSM